MGTGNLPTEMLHATLTDVHVLCEPHDTIEARCRESFSDAALKQMNKQVFRLDVLQEAIAHSGAFWPEVL